MRQAILLGVSASVVLAAMVVGSSGGPAVRGTLDLVNMVTVAADQPTGPATPLIPVAPVVAGPRPFTASFSEQDLTDAAAKAFPQSYGGATASDPVVQVLPGSVRLVAKARMFFGTTQLVIAATPFVTDGKLDVRVDSATLGGMGLPDATRASIASSVLGAIGPLVPAKTRIDGIDVGGGTVTLRGVALP